MPRWGMVLDLDRCIGCYSCTVACRVENGTPPGIWYAPVYEQEVGSYPHVKRVFLPTLCMHCKDAPCMKACPTGAISRRGDGIVLINQDLCCGSRACVAACPYGAMHFNGDGRGDFEGQLTPFEQSFQGKSQVGTVQKCTLCVHRIDRGILTPACVEACPTACRIFGDLDDPESPPSKLIAQHNGFALRPEAGTNPSVRYVTPGAFLSGQATCDDRGASSPQPSQTQSANPGHQVSASGGSRTPSANAFTGRLNIEAKPQTVWGLNHALWFLCMGLGSGLYLNRLLFGIEVGQVLGLPLADVLGIPGPPPPHARWNVLLKRMLIASWLALNHFQSAWMSCLTFSSVAKSRLWWSGLSVTFLLDGEYHSSSDMSFWTFGESMWLTNP